MDMIPVQASDPPISGVCMYVFDLESVVSRCMSQASVWHHMCSGISMSVQAEVVEQRVITCAPCLLVQQWCVEVRATVLSDSVSTSTWPESIYIPVAFFISSQDNCS